MADINRKEHTGRLNLPAARTVSTFTPHRRATRTGPGFTLVELLVVVSIIALLIALLLPSLKGAREQAKLAVCVTNLRGIATASITYAAEDRHEQAVPVHPMTVHGPDPGAYDWGGKSGGGEPATGTSPLQSVWGTAYGRGPGTRPLNAVFFKSPMPDYQDNRGRGEANWWADYKLDLRQYRCPSDRGYRGHHLPGWANSRLSSYDHYGNSYAANTLWCSWHSSKCTPIIHSPFLRPRSRIPNPANTVYYFENCGRFAWSINLDEKSARCATTTDGPHYNQSSDKSIVTGWHGKPFLFAAAFADSHAGVIKMEGHQVPPPHLPRYPWIDGYEQGYNAWECHLVRGPGWQLDTLPAHPTEADFPCGLSMLPANWIR